MMNAYDVVMMDASDVLRFADEMDVDSLFGDDLVFDSFMEVEMAKLDDSESVCSDDAMEIDEEVEAMEIDEEDDPMDVDGDDMDVDGDDMDIDSEESNHDSASPMELCDEDCEEMDWCVVSEESAEVVFMECSCFPLGEHQMEWSAC